jgi:alpha/beta superfamily hydrolase
MKEEQVFFQAGQISIEGLYTDVGGSRAAIVSHPHSQMGGCMWNNVVEALVHALSGKGFSTLRFNFRGVGRSGGSYDNGRGEQEDVKGALDFLREKAREEEVVLTGYSFGAWVNARVLSQGEGTPFADAIFVSPPLNMMKFDVSGLTGKVGLAICGDHDQFCSQTVLQPWAAEIGCRVEMIPGADHFYWGKEREIIASINAYFQ